MVSAWFAVEGTRFFPAFPADTSRCGEEYLTAPQDAAQRGNKTKGDTLAQPEVSHVGRSSTNGRTRPLSLTCFGQGKMEKSLQRTPSSTLKSKSRETVETG